MKKAYNEHWVENKRVLETVTEWYNYKLLTNSQLDKSIVEFPVGFHKSNIFVKTGLFLFTNVVASSFIGFISIFLFSMVQDSQIGSGVLILIYGAIFFYSLEYFIKKNHFYRSGIDNALIYLGLGSVITAYIIFTDANLPFWVYCIFYLFVASIILARYADPFVAISLFIAFIAFVFDLITKFSLGKIILPFVIMLVSVGIFFILKFWKKIGKSNYYSICQEIFEVLAAATFYLGGNYFVVREGNAMLNNLSDSVQIDFAFVFYLFTALVPVIYVIYGLRKRDRKILILGLLAVAFSVFTFRHYYSVMPLEWALCLAGILLINLSIWAIRKLEKQKMRLTSHAMGSNKYQNLEALIVNQVIPQSGQSNDSTQFGGGDFGGGGSGGGY